LAETLVGDLAAHGVEAEHLSDWTNTGEMTAVEALFVRRPRHAGRRSHRRGAFGSSRIYEGLFGAVTLHFMHQQSCRLLMWHEWVKRRDSDQKYGAAPWPDTEAKLFNACRRPQLHGRVSVINPKALGLRPKPSDCCAQ
jgi:hypothetical protein